MTDGPEDPGRYREYAPSAPLEPFVSCFWSRRAPAGATTRILPDGAVDIVFELSDSSKAPTALVVGTMTTPLVVTPAKDSLYLGARFRPGGAQPLLALPMNQLTNLRVDLKALGPNSLAPDWWERLHGTGSVEEQVSLFDELLVREVLRTPKTPHPRVGAAVQEIERCSGRISVGLLSRSLGLSRQHLTRLFEHHVGIGIKAFSRIIRMQSVLAEARERAAGDEQAADWATLAYEFGYCDQSHLSSDFKAFTGLSPRRFSAHLVSDK